MPRTPIGRRVVGGTLLTLWCTLAAPASAQTARIPDSLLNGALIGAGAGVASGLLICRTMEPWDVCLQAEPLIAFGAVGAGIGLAVDALIRRRRPEVDAMTSPSRLRVAPVLGRHLRGVRLSIGF